MCVIWDWQSTIVKDLNDSQDPKYTLFCRENAFVAICALFQTTNVAERGQSHLFLPFFYFGAPLKPNVVRLLVQSFVLHHLIF